MSLKSCPRPPFVYLAVKNVTETCQMDFFRLCSFGFFQSGVQLYMGHYADDTSIAFSHLAIHFVS